MLIIDDLLMTPITGPIKGMMWLAGKIKKAADDEIEGRGDRIMAELSELYMMLDTGGITEEEFAKRETQLLDGLDALDAYKKAAAGQVDEVGEEGEEEVDEDEEDEEEDEEEVDEDEEEPSDELETSGDDA